MHPGRQDRTRRASSAVTDGQLWMLIGDGFDPAGLSHRHAGRSGRRFASAGAWHRPRCRRSRGSGSVSTSRRRGHPRRPGHRSCGRSDRRAVAVRTWPSTAACGSAPRVGARAASIVASGAIDLRVPVGTGAERLDRDHARRGVGPQSSHRCSPSVGRETGAIVDTYTADVTSGGDTIYAFGSIWTAAYSDHAGQALPLRGARLSAHQEPLWASAGAIPERSRRRYSATAMTSVLFLCTGNAARSVDERPRRCGCRGGRTSDVETAGTLTVDGLPISWRSTRATLADVGLPPWPRHASRQAEQASTSTPPT